jgi:hypothetical protein
MSEDAGLAEFAEHLLVLSASVFVLTLAVLVVVAFLRQPRQGGQERAAGSVGRSFPGSRRKRKRATSVESWVSMERLRSGNARPLE